MFMYCDYMKFKLFDNFLNGNYENTYSKKKIIYKKIYFWV